MILNIHGHKIKITRQLHDTIEDHVKKIKHYFDHIITANVTVARQKNTVTAEATVIMGHHHFHNKLSSDNKFKSVELLFDKIEDQVRRYKDYITSHKSGGVRELVSDLLDAEEKIKVTVLDEVIEKKPMSDLEAVLELAGSRSVFSGYYLNPASEHASFLEKTSAGCNLYVFDGHWEKRSIVLDKRKNILNTDTVENLHIVKDSLESSVDFLILEKNPFRIFESVRTGKICLLYRKNKTSFGLIREI
ncbi:MAG: ribosomal subunit interface protein [Spirochaetes bacterium GWF1_41_5]|nr:MAG: ribosomal subunit interface protein [Spirochaetes bacterium GWF1_41_5]HBE01110.1 ribosome-associated translation inhibitor RaiA [Spirochaetia bacterium]